MLLLADSPVYVATHSRDETREILGELAARPGPQVVVIEVRYELSPGFTAWSVEMLQACDLGGLVVVTDSMCNRWKFHLVKLLAQAPYPIEIVTPNELTLTLSRLGLAASVI